MLNTTRKFGERIQELRKLRKMSQAQLAELIGVEVVTISRIEGGKRFPKKENIVKIARVLNVEIKELFDFEHHKSKMALKKEIQSLIKNADIEDLKYIQKLLRIYFEAK